MSRYLGQHFLCNPRIQSYIVDIISLFCSKYHLEAIIEIGPGRGYVTKKIYSLVTHFLAVEKDTRMSSFLSGFLSPEQYVFSDILDVSIDFLLQRVGLCTSGSVLIFGNLPYYITSPILRKFFANPHYSFGGGIFMVQKEVAEKISDTAKKKSYLRRLLHYTYNVLLLKNRIGSDVFSPPPKVSSSVIGLVPHHQKYSISFEALVQFLDAFSPYSRKTLKSIVKNYATMYHIPDYLANKRLEDCSFSDISRIITA